MPVKIIITKTLEDWWGADDLRSAYPDDELFNVKLTELCMEDTAALLDGATWEIAEAGTATPLIDRLCAALEAQQTNQRHQQQMKELEAVNDGLQERIVVLRAALEASESARAWLELRKKELEQKNADALREAEQTERQRCIGIVSAVKTAQRYSYVGVMQACGEIIHRIVDPALLDSVAPPDAENKR